MDQIEQFIRDSGLDIPAYSYVVKEAFYISLNEPFCTIEIVL